MRQENYIAPGARVIGDVQLGKNASVWYNAAHYVKLAELQMKRKL
jgi:carbonic anhydrase/acetyltransferase-like protein (isoleucine patch superfamily)